MRTKYSGQDVKNWSLSVSSMRTSLVRLVDLLGGENMGNVFRLACRRVTTCSHMEMIVWIEI